MRNILYYLGLGLSVVALLFIVGTIIKSLFKK
jgi:hypothetical protein